MKPRTKIPAPHANTTYGVKAMTELIVIVPMLFHINSKMQHDSTVPNIIWPARFFGSRDGSWTACAVAAIHLKHLLWCVAVITFRFNFNYVFAVILVIDAQNDKSK